MLCTHGAVSERVEPSAGKQPSSSCLPAVASLVFELLPAYSTGSDMSRSLSARS